MKTYFCLSEYYNDEHIGIVVASNTKELNEKIHEALESHFDCEVLPFDEVEFEDMMGIYGVPFTFEVYLKDDPYPLDVGILRSYIF